MRLQSPARASAKNRRLGESRDPPITPRSGGRVDPGPRRADGENSTAERVVDDRFLLRRQRVVERFERRAGLLQRLQPRLEGLLATAHAIEERPLPLRPGLVRKAGADLALLVGASLNLRIQLVPQRLLLRR